MKKPLGISCLCLLLAGCGTTLQTVPPTQYAIHTVSAGEGLPYIAAKYYNDAKAGWLYLREINKGQLKGGEVAPGQKVIVPDKREFETWRRDNETSLERLIPPSTVKELQSSGANAAAPRRSP